MACITLLSLQGATSKRRLLLSSARVCILDKNVPAEDNPLASAAPSPRDPTLQRKKDVPIMQCELPSPRCMRLTSSVHLKKIVDLTLAGALALAVMLALAGLSKPVQAQSFSVLHTF